MSKMDGLRQMREARYERSLTKATLRGDESPRAAKPAGRAAGPKAPADEPADDTAAARSDDTADVAAASDASGKVAASTEALCGHRAISGRTCTREQGHAAKSHRYS